MTSTKEEVKNLIFSFFNHSFFFHKKELVTEPKATPLPLEPIKNAYIQADIIKK